MKKAAVLEKITLGIALLLSCGLSSSFAAQQGRQGTDQRTMADSIQAINGSISRYLNGDEIESVLTPGSSCDWKLDLKAGQVVAAEARSDTFDPALQVTDDKGAVKASNDDRYPGDQRPLLLWRCPRDGSYQLQVTSFKNKAGGQFYVRFTTYSCIDLNADSKTVSTVPGGVPFLYRFHMQAGEISRILEREGGNDDFQSFKTQEIMNSSGLPDIGLAEPLAPITNTTIFMAPVTGDYYGLASPNSDRREPRRVNAWTEDIVPRSAAADGKYSATAPANTPALWEVSVKKGDLLKASAPDLSIASQMVISEVPDISKFDPSKPDENPFYPRAGQPSPSPAFQILPSRMGDGRGLVFCALRDAKLWIGTNAAGPSQSQFTFSLKSAASDFAEGKVNTGSLQIANRDYWAFDAQPGDVMTLQTSASGFREVVSVLGPDLGEMVMHAMPLDQSKWDWQMVINAPGRYLTSVSCNGSGGSGAYTLSRQVHHPKEFGLNSPANGAIADGQVQVWKFSVQPDHPLLVHWTSSNWNYDVQIYDAQGHSSDFQRDQFDDHNRFGLIKVSQPQTFIIVLTGRGGPAQYSIALNPVPGYGSASVGAKK